MMPSAGPYRLVEFVVNESAVLEANQHYVGRAPSIARIEVRVFETAEALAAAFESNAIDLVVPGALTPEAAADLATRRGGRHRSPGRGSLRAGPRRQLAVARATRGAPCHLAGHRPRRARHRSVRATRRTGGDPLAGPRGCPRGSPRLRPRRGARGARSGRCPRGDHPAHPHGPPSRPPHRHHGARRARGRGPGGGATRGGAGDPGRTQPRARRPDAVDDPWWR
ncbi:MAG: hypothetical protein IPH72_34745 [Sandaracinaceae bacterium]|nr:hypothetical protein [Sandaracinaceae bacterium]